MNKSITHFCCGGARHSHKLSAVLSFLLLFLIAGSARAEGEGTGTEETNSTIFKYTEVEGGISITGFKDGCSAVNLEIPSEIDGKTVVAIGNEAFVSQQTIKSIKIPSSVTTIGEYAFCNTGITSIEIPSSVTTIENCVFSGCESLTSVTFSRIPVGKNTLEGYGENLFWNVPNIKSIYVPGGCEEIYKARLSDNANLIQGVDIVSGGLKYAVNEAKDGLVCKGFSGEEMTEVTIPAKVQGVPVTAIGERAFRKTSISSVSIPSTVKEISNEAFFDCQKLVNVSIADGSQLTTIGQGAFIHCVILEGMVIPSSVETIRDGAFEYCFTLKSMVIPSSVETIGAVAFSDCYQLSSITFQRIPTEENSIAGYSNDIFWTTSGASINVSYMFVPGGCEEIYKAQLSDNANLIQGVDIVSGGLKYALNEAKDGLVCKGFSGEEMTEVTIPAMVQGIPVTAIGQSAFKKTSITSVSIPSTVKEISKEAFYNCETLESMVIPSSVETIGGTAFSECFKLSSITFQRIPTEENSIAGYSVDMFLQNAEFEKLKYVSVPAGTVAAYTAQLPSSVSNFIIADGGKVTLTDETGFACEDKTLYRAGDLSYERTLDANGEYATLCLPYALDLGNMDGAFEKVYVPMNTLIHNTAKSTSDLEHFVLMLEEQASDAIIPAGQPIFVKLSDTVDKIALQNNEDEMLTADLQPKSEAMKIVDWDGTSGLMTQNKQFSISYGSLYQPKTDVSADDHIWSFNANGSFGPQSEGAMPPFRLFLKVEKNAPTVQAKAYSISLGVSDDSTTGIREIISSDAIGSSSTNASRNAGIIYDLNGRKVATASEAKHLGKGIYILNGKKMVVK